MQLFIPATAIGTPVVLLMIGWYYSFLIKGGQAPKGVFRQLAWRGFWMLIIGVVAPIVLSSAEFWLIGPVSRSSPATVAAVGNVVVAAMLAGILRLIWSAVRVFGASPPGTSTLGEEQLVVATDPQAALLGEIPRSPPTAPDPRRASGGSMAVAIGDLESAQIFPGATSTDEKSGEKGDDPPV